MSHLEITLFGPFRATLDGVPLLDFESNKVRALLAYLGTESAQPHHRLEVATLLWPQMNDAAALRNLRHAIADLRRRLGDTKSENPFLLITRHTLQINPGADITVDVADFRDNLARASAPETSEEDAVLLWQSAVSLAQQEFLQGFHVRGSVPWDEWLLLQREGFEHEIVLALQRLVWAYERRGDYAHAQGCAQQWVQRSPWNEEAHRKLIRVLALDGRRSEALAQYERCRLLLAHNLGVEPTPETVSLAESIRNGSFPTPVLPHLRRSTPSVKRNGVLSQCHFVSRQGEMEALERLLEKALSGEPQMAFVTGEAGTGKSALALAFGRNALGRYGDMVVLRGESDAFAGRGDPFLPFRDILLSLVGDADALHLGRELGEEYLRRIQRLTLAFIPILVQTAPDLVDALDLASVLLMQAEAFLPQSVHKRELLRDLRRLESHRRSSFSNPSQSQSFTQFTHLLSYLSDISPLLLILDDLQWADSESLSLLFHLGRRLRDGRVMLLGIFRSEEVLGSTGGDHPPHPLAQVVHELQRYRGDILIDLDRSMDREFVDAYLDAERNRLGESFRQRLYHHTGGNALFTVELLRALQERGDLTMDAEGFWCNSSSLAWEQMPPRIEAVIAERIERLPQRWREVLLIASVSGESFSAEALARALSWPLDEVRRILDALSAFPRRLVQFRGHSWVAKRMLSVYRFRHILFQSYLYGSLSDGQKVRWHGRLGNALEEIYGEQREGIAPTLARHFEYSGLPLKAAGYYLLAGRHAMQLFAPAEALALYSRGMALLQEAPESPERAEQEMRLQMSMSAPLLAMQGWGAPERVQVTQKAYELCRRSGNEQALTQALFLQADMLRARGEHSLSLQLGQQLLGLAEQEGAASGLALAHWTLGETYFFQGDLLRAREHLRQALVHYTFQGSTLTPLTATDLGVVCHVWMAWTEELLGNAEVAERHARTALDMARSLEQPLSLIFALTLGGYGFQWLRGDPEAAAAFEDELSPLMEREELAGVRPWGLVFQGWVLAESGDLAGGIGRMRRGVEEWKGMGAVCGLTCQMVPLIEANVRAGLIAEAGSLAEEALELVERTGEKLFEQRLMSLREEALAQAG